MTHDLLGNSGKLRNDNHSHYQLAQFTSAPTWWCCSATLHQTGALQNAPHWTIDTLAIRQWGQIVKRRYEAMRARERFRTFI